MIAAIIMLLSITVVYLIGLVIKLSRTNAILEDYIHMSNVESDLNQSFDAFMSATYTDKKDLQ
jgi:hypothetical protein